MATAIDPNTFANNFFGMTKNMLTMQMQQTERAMNTVQAASQNGLALVNASANQANMYYYGLAHQQTAFSHQIGQQYASIAKTAVKKMGRGGLLGLLGF